MVAFALGKMLYAVYHYFDDEIEITEVDDIMADLVQFSLLFDPFRDSSLVVIDLSRLPS